MRVSGRVSLISILAIIGVVAVLLIIFIFSRESVEVNAAKFMDALVRSDTKTLSQLSYMPGETPDQIEKQWEFTTGVAGKYYGFSWRITGSSEPAPPNPSTPASASVKLSVMRNFGAPGSYEENYALPMIKDGGIWKVEVSGISREMYPDLPTTN